ncbi:helix-turn-helix domain-containing protein [Actinacidiphila bryophytorum]|uniref:Arylsulfatase regulatory protein n=1 Tax=Actinacidiphila bryophytorum TaxID=1436133 RepID=A0A9W4M8Z0_9ACTN|nr:helix-turn-helix transcriptional regulator [Actinacidiphila bryophytorum]MBM9438725.1 helix-turn-helix transcriptional regulator [Actinacidiphila bryophytorum]MBN6545544.1 helix-turn-helix transcriptional regulator [Actinacidiphila bryophytorum]CAG7637591.1 Arylsulfatase regulatory protein [Actinacidiphila bryophytorum]
MSDGLRSIRKARGWSQERLVGEIERYARQHVTDVASTASLKVYVSEWEHGKRSISDCYALILRALLGITDAELRGAPSDAVPSTADGYDDLLARIDAASSVSHSLVKTFNDQTELIRTMDRQMGAAGLVDQMSGHLSALEDALNFAVLPDTRRPVALALAGASTLAAWQALDTGAVERAWRHYELAKRAAQDADAPMYLAHAMAEQAYVLCEAGRPALGVALVRDARETVGRRASPRLLAWLYATEAELCAQAGMPAESRRALDAAARSIPDGSEDRDPDMLSIFLNGGHLARWQGNVLAMLGDDDAVGRLYDALEVVDGTFVRAQAGLRCDLAHAHLSRGEYDQANTHLRQARLLANRTGSVRQRRRIDLLSARL